MLGRKIVDFREVLRHVVELPYIIFERPCRIGAVVGHQRRCVKNDRLPAVVVQGARSQHLVILRNVFAWSERIIQRRSKTHAFDRRLFHACNRIRRIDADELEERGHDVDGVHVLMSGATFGSNPSRPAEDERVRHAAFMGVALESLEGSISSPCPSPRVVVVGPGSTEIVDTLEVLLKALGDEVEEVLLVE